MFIRHGCVLPTRHAIERCRMPRILVALEEQYSIQNITTTHKVTSATSIPNDVDVTTSLGSSALQVGQTSECGVMPW